MIYYSVFVPALINGLYYITWVGVKESLRLPPAIYVRTDKSNTLYRHWIRKKRTLKKSVESKYLLVVSLSPFSNLRTLWAQEFFSGSGIGCFGLFFFFFFFFEKMMLHPDLEKKTAWLRLILFNPLKQQQQQQQQQQYSVLRSISPFENKQNDERKKTIATAQNFTDLSIKSIWVGGCTAKCWIPKKKYLRLFGSYLPVYCCRLFNLQFLLLLLLLGL